MAESVVSPGNAGQMLDQAERIRKALPRQDRPGERMRRDMAWVIGLTLLVWFCAWHFEISEHVFHWTRAREHYQLDELPIVLLALALMMLWFSRRRFREAQAALHLHDLAEQRLAHLLEENRHLARRTIDVQEVERRNLARELHDEMGQYLNAIKIDAVTLQRHAAPLGGNSGDALAGILRNVNHVYWVINDMIRRLRPAGLDELGLAAALESCVDGWRQRLQDVAFQFSIDGDLSGLDEQTSLTVYRMVQEGLTNVAKHAGATRVTIVVACKPRDDGLGEQQPSRWLTVTMQDDGRGAAQCNNPDAGSGPVLPGTGLGLIGMRERVQALDGELILQVPENREKGFGLVARIPVKRLGAA